MKAKLNKMRKILLDRATFKATKDNNDYVLTLLKGINIKNFSQADSDLLNDYLEIPEGTFI